VAAVDVSGDIDDDVTHQVQVVNIRGSQAVAAESPHRPAVSFGIAGLGDEIVLEAVLRPEHIDAVVANLSKRL